MNALLPTRCVWSVRTQIVALHVVQLFHLWEFPGVHPESSIQPIKVDCVNYRLPDVLLQGRRVDLARQARSRFRTPCFPNVSGPSGLSLTRAL